LDIWTCRADVAGDKLHRQEAARSSWTYLVHSLENGDKDRCLRALGKAGDLRLQPDDPHYPAPHNVDPIIPGPNDSTQTQNTSWV
jgi:hypothetical protein